MGTHSVNIHKELLEKSKTGDRSAQFKLYELYVDAMYNVVLRILGNREEAEDILQETFVDAFKNLKKFRYESTFGAWIKRIAINKSLNHLKTNKIKITPIEDHEYYLAEEKEEPIEYDMRKIKIGISKLPHGFKQIFSLYLLEGYSHKEIAEILEISEATSKSQYHRAKKKLIELIKTL
ncbi:MAG: RNA polymerase sigma factor [Eudoraea sp.]|uniref:RNA polymerase sigma factor n=1 Tax=Eudoraea sp. TaxID=1979955 RepID=UPI003C7746C3